MEGAEGQGLDGELARALDAIDLLEHVGIRADLLGVQVKHQVGQTFPDGIAIGKQRVLVIGASMRVHQRMLVRMSDRRNAVGVDQAGNGLVHGFGIGLQTLDQGLVGAVWLHVHPPVRECASMIARFRKPAIFVTRITILRRVARRIRP